MTSLDRIDVIIRYLLTTNYARGKNIVKTLYKRRTIHFPRILFVKMHQEINFTSSGEEKSINSAENKPNY